MAVNKEKIEIKADDKEQVICVKVIEDEGKYFVLLEVTKEKYEEIKEKMEKNNGKDNKTILTKK